MSVAKLSVLITAHNEADQLAACLDSAAFADEVVVLLDNCTDASKQIAESAQVVIVEGHWLIEGERRMAGLAACTGDWILELDADERVPDNLQREIRQYLENPVFGYCQIPFDNYVGKRLVKRGWGCSWGINAKNCLFARGAKTWGAQRVHPKITLQGKKVVLTHAIVHYSFKDIRDMVDRFNAYTTRRALDLLENPVKQSMARNIKRIFSRFFKCYVQRRGYQEGVYGLLNGIFAGLFPLVSYLKYLELSDQSAD